MITSLSVSHNNIYFELVEAVFAFNIHEEKAIMINRQGSNDYVFPIVHNFFNETQKGNFVLRFRKMCLN